MGLSGGGNEIIQPAIKYSHEIVAAGGSNTLTIDNLNTNILDSARSILIKFYGNNDNTAAGGVSTITLYDDSDNNGVYADGLALTGSTSSVSAGAITALTGPVLGADKSHYIELEFYKKGSVYFITRKVMGASLNVISSIVWTPAAGKILKKIVWSAAAARNFSTNSKIQVFYYQ